jgi:hypothetical protein
MLYNNQVLSGSNTPKDSKDALQALRMNRKPCHLTAHPATKYLAVSHFETLTTSFFTN